MTTATATATTAATSFEKFPRLPAELRHMIWKASMERDTGAVYPFGSRWVRHVCAGEPLDVRIPAPAALQVDREARGVALGWIRDRGARVEPPRRAGEGPGPSVVRAWDPARDYVYVASERKERLWQMMNSITADDDDDERGDRFNEAFKAIRHLALPAFTAYYSLTWLVQVVGHMPQLERIYVVWGPLPELGSSEARRREAGVRQDKLGWELEDDLDLDEWDEDEWGEEGEDEDDEDDDDDEVGGRGWDVGIHPLADDDLVYCEESTEGDEDPDYIDDDDDHHDAPAPPCWQVEKIVYGRKRGSGGDAEGEEKEEDEEEDKERDDGGEDDDDDDDDDDDQNSEVDGPVVEMHHRGSSQAGRVGPWMSEMLDEMQLTEVDDSFAQRWVDDGLGEVTLEFVPVRVVEKRSTLGCEPVTTTQQTT